LSIREKILPRDIIAVILICGGLYLKFLGMNGTISTILIGIVGFYFGAELFKEKMREE